MKKSSKYLEAVIREFSKLPGIGSKTASRLAFHILSIPKVEALKLSDSIVDFKNLIKICSECGGIADNDICYICADETRERSSICVVESARDILIIEGTGEFKGNYHVLGGLISPLDGISPEELNFNSLVSRVEKYNASELILAINPTIEGEVTALYIANLFKSKNIDVSRIAHGLPVGADLEFTDNATIIKSIEGRVKI